MSDLFGWDNIQILKYLQQESKLKGGNVRKAYLSCCALCDKKIENKSLSLQQNVLAVQMQDMVNFFPYSLTLCKSCQAQFNFKKKVNYDSRNRECIIK